MDYRFYLRIVGLLMVYCFFVGCAKVDSLSYRTNSWEEPNYPIKAKFDGPPFSPREKGAKMVKYKTYQAHGAGRIGSFRIIASNYDKMLKAAPKEAAKVGADFFSIEEVYNTTEQQWVHKKSRSYWKRIGGSKQLITEDTYGTVERGTKAFKIELYRIAPTNEHRDYLRSLGLKSCLSSCGSCDTFTVYAGKCPTCEPQILQEYVNLGVKLQDKAIETFMECIVKNPKSDLSLTMYHKVYLRQDYKKLEILLNAYPTNLKGYSSGFQMVKKKINNLDKYIRKAKKPNNLAKVHYDFLKRVEALLVSRGIK